MTSSSSINKTHWIRFVIQEVYGTNGSGEEELSGGPGYYTELNKIQFYCRGQLVNISSVNLSTYSVSAGGFNTTQTGTTNTNNILGGSGTNWVFNATGMINMTNPVYVIFQFAQIIEFDGYVLTTGSNVYSGYNDARNPVSWELQISKNGIDWENVDIQKNYTDGVYPNHLNTLGSNARSYRLPQNGSFSLIYIYNRDIPTLNGILSFPEAMPFKDPTSDGSNTFSMGRHQYVNTIAAINAPPPANYQQKKWIGWRDASQVTQTQRISAVGLGSMNSDGKAMSFKNVLDHNTARNARQRARSGGYIAPLKKGKSTNFM
jgi:hypothetical protein